jgi:hypothetical protein
MHLHPVNAGENTVTGSDNDWFWSHDHATKGGSVEKKDQGFSFQGSGARHGFSIL